MTLTILKDKYLTLLSKVYNKDEILSIFRLLVKYKLNIDAAAIVLEGNKTLSENNLVFFKTALQRLQDKEPVQYIISETNFYGLNFKVTPDVLIPRPETEELVEWIITSVKEKFLNKKLKILDIGTGSGCIAISLAKNTVNTEVTALDISEKALLIAKENAETNNIAIQFIQADILKLKQLTQNYDIIVSNPPYVREQEKLQMHDNVLKYEPTEALYVNDKNPLVFYEKIAEFATSHLKENGSIFFEINQYLGKETVELLENKGFTKIVLRKDFLGKDRMISASKT